MCSVYPDHRPAGAAACRYKHGHAKGIGWHPQTPKYAKTTLEMCTGDLTLDSKLNTRDLLKLLQLYGSLFKKGTCGQPPPNTHTTAHNAAAAPQLRLFSLQEAAAWPGAEPPCLLSL